MYEIMIYLKSSNSSHLFKHPRADWDPVLNIDHHMRIIQIPRQCRSLHDETVASGFHISQAEQCFFFETTSKSLDRLISIQFQFNHHFVFWQTYQYIPSKNQYFNNRFNIILLFSIYQPRQQIHSWSNLT